MERVTPKADRIKTCFIKNNREGMSVNKIILLGYVGSDPEVRYPEKDFAVARFSLATSERKGNSELEITDWHTCIVAGRNAAIAEKYVRKGTRLYVEGKMRYREYEDRFKIKRRVAEVEVLNFELLGQPQQK